ncbi:MAG: PTPDL family protein [Akkermansiaceae bacterium]
MTFRKFSFAAASLICCGSLHSADTIVLRSGEKIDGYVVREEGNSLVIEVKVSNTIKDERIVAKSDVQYIEKEKEDAKAFDKIADLFPTPSLLKVENYDARIAAVNEFKEKFPESQFIAEADEMLKLLTEELEVVKVGGIKMGEEMISAEEYEANAYGYDAHIATKNIADSIARGEFLKALYAFEEYEKTFSDSVERKSLVGKIRGLLTTYGSRIDSSLATFDSRMERRNAGLESMTGDDRTSAERAIKEEQDRLNSIFQREKKAGALWITPNVNFKESLEEARRQVDRAISKLEGDSRRKEVETPLAEAYRNAWIQISEGLDEDDGAKTLFDKLKQLRMPEVYVKKLRDHAGLEE